MMPLWQELPLLLVVAFCLAVLIRTFLLQAFFIPSSSMDGHACWSATGCWSTRSCTTCGRRERGEIVVFRGTDNWAPETPPEPAGSLVGRIGRTLGDLVGVSRPGEKDFIKRVIGLPGDRVSCCDPQGRVYVNGQAIDEPYIYSDSPLDAAAQSAGVRAAPVRRGARAARSDVRHGRPPAGLAGLAAARARCRSRTSSAGRS